MVDIRCDHTYAAAAARWFCRRMARTVLLGCWQQSAAQRLRGVLTRAGVDRENPHSSKNCAIAHLSVFLGIVMRSSLGRLSPTRFYPSCAQRSCRREVYLHDG